MNETTLCLFVGGPLHGKWLRIDNRHTLAVTGSVYVYTRRTFYHRERTSKVQHEVFWWGNRSHAHALPKDFAPRRPPNFPRFVFASDYLPAADWWDDHNEPAKAELLRNWAANVGASGAGV